MNGPQNNELKLTKSAKASVARPSQLNSVFGGLVAMPEEHMGVWDSIQSLRSLSHGLMWATALLAMAAAGATWFRYYVDRRIGELSGAQQAKRDEEARARQDRAEQELAQVRLRASPRHLDREKFRQEVTGGPVGAIRILASTLDQEAKAYAAEFAEVLREAGWEVDFPERQIPINAPPGLTLVVSATGEPPEPAGFLQQAARRCGLEVKGIADTEEAAGGVVLIVGQKQ
jgi:hypothetical protein